MSGGVIFIYLLYIAFVLCYTFATLLYGFGWFSVVLERKRVFSHQKEETANPLYIKDLAVFYGDPSEIRTPDTLIKSQVLYRLS